MVMHDYQKGANRGFIAAVILSSNRMKYFGHYLIHGRFNFKVGHHTIYS